MFKKQSQFELFPGAPEAAPQKGESRFSFHPWTLTFENMVVVSVVFLMSLIIAFAFGVEQGKGLQISQAAGSAVLTKTVSEKTQVLASQNVGDVLIMSAAVDPGGVSKKTTVEIVGKDLFKMEQKGAEAEKSVDKTPSLDTIHTIQVASFKQKERADREAETLIQKKLDAFVAKKGSYYIVCVGKYSESSQASGMLKTMRKTYKDCLIRSL